MTFYRGFLANSERVDRMRMGIETCIEEIIHKIFDEMIFWKRG